MPCRRGWSIWHVATAEPPYEVSLGEPTRRARRRHMSGTRAPVQKWFYEPAESSTFYEQFTQAYGGIASGKVQWSALAHGLPAWGVMLVIVLLDNMLKLASTETALGIDLDYNREVRRAVAPPRLQAMGAHDPARPVAGFAIPSPLPSPSPSP